LEISEPDSVLSVNKRKTMINTRFAFWVVFRNIKNLD